MIFGYVVRIIMKVVEIDIVHDKTLKIMSQTIIAKQCCTSTHQ